MDRVPVYETVGCRFESCRAHFFLLLLSAIWLEVVALEVVVAECTFGAELDASFGFTASPTTVHL